MFEKLMQYFEPYETGLSVLIEDLDSGETISWNADCRFPSASIIKYPILYCFLEKVTNGEESLKDTHVLRETDKVGESVYDTGILRELHEGIEITMEDCLRLMIDVSDDTATNIIMKRMSFRYMNDAFIKYGLVHTSVGRYMMDYAGIEKGYDNFISPQDTNRLSKLLLSNSYLSGECREFALDVLFKQRENDGFNKLFPDEVPYAHKCGCIRQYLLDHECGILYWNGKPRLTINFCSKGIRGSRELMNRAGREIYTILYRTGNCE